ncbi:cell division protein ZapA [Virgibacillus sp. MSP4-1]|uniref:Cell division protein ZapA n=1 Tax=Salinibacillus aidingensis TaxID=237684 RepID=A0ABP3KNM2_9BACI|nr:cell division protein ZapA [Virgibacillus sp. MSP4-1]QHS22960.1 cell division protein ZapA [Virgibacillus sp. MSP4-1]
MSHSDQNRTTVYILNRKYTIVGDEPPHHIEHVADLVDQKMKEIQENNPRLDTAKLAVLTAVNTMNEYIQLQEEYRLLTEQTRRGERRKNG